MNNQPANDDFVQLVEDNKGIIIRICNSYCHHKNDREDLAQEIIYQLWKSVGKFKQEHKFTTWMYRVALNVDISCYRKENKPGAIIPVSENHITIEDHPGNNYELDEKVSQLQQFINRLKTLDRALMLLYLEEKSYAEIAEILGISETNVATKISRIKEKLKQNFSTVKV
jgi:RNA polymerase sigma-70 factor (ECF subfamily)